MPLSPSFSTAESLSVLENVTFTDTSTGSDVGLTGRTIEIRLANGNWLDTSGESTTQVLIAWAIGDLSTTLALLTNSTTASVTVRWMTGSTVTYAVSNQLETWDLYDYDFGLELIQSQTATPGIVQDTNYYSNFFMFITNIWNAEKANTYGDDLYSSQSALDRNLNLMNNSDYYF